MEWLNNPWVVGIGGSVLGGLLVTVVSRALLSRRDRREYVQRLLSANREVIYAIRPGISEEHIADRRVVELLISATARKYTVDKADLQDPTQGSRGTGQGNHGLKLHLGKHERPVQRSVGVAVPIPPRSNKSLLACRDSGRRRNQVWQSTSHGWSP